MNWNNWNWNRQGLQSSSIIHLKSNHTMIYDIEESSVSYVLKLQIGSRGHQFPLSMASKKVFVTLVTILFPLSEPT